MQSIPLHTVTAFIMNSSSRREGVSELARACVCACNFDTMCIIFVVFCFDKFCDYSNCMPSLFQMGFDALVIGRIDFQDDEERKKTKTMEFVWETSPNAAGMLCTCCLLSLSLSVFEVFKFLTKNLIMRTSLRVKHLPFNCFCQFYRTCHKRMWRQLRIHVYISLK